MMVGSSQKCLCLCQCAKPDVNFQKWHFPLVAKNFNIWKLETIGDLSPFKVNNVKL